MLRLVTKDLWPNPGTLASNVTFKNEAQVEYDSHKTGNLSLTH